MDIDQFKDDTITLNVSDFVQTDINATSLPSDADLIITKNNSNDKSNINMIGDSGDKKNDDDDDDDTTGKKVESGELDDNSATLEGDPFEFFSFSENEEQRNVDEVYGDNSEVDLSLHKEYSYPSDPSREDDKDCPFLDSSLYRSVYVYPTWKNEADGWHGPILSTKYTNITEWPWLYEEKRAKEGRFGHYGPARNQMGQYTLELIVREIMTHSDSCLRTMDPLKATLFYVPYLPSVEFHKGKTYAVDYSTSSYATAISNAIEGNYEDWEQLFGLTSDFWKRKKGADHILVFSEPLHGLSHPRNKRGSYHFIHTQKMLTPPIIVSVEVSTSFVKKYPKCSAKNIVVPYPNPDGNWFNGAFDKEAISAWKNLTEAKAFLQAENETITIASSIQINDHFDLFQPRPVAQYYSAGNHGTCTYLRKSMSNDFHCTASSDVLNKKGKVPYHFGMRVSTFCPAPGGDSPSAKRMFDVVNSGCIPIILSHDYVWPFTNEADQNIPLNSSLFSLRWQTSELWEAKYTPQCELKENASPSLQAKIEQIKADEIFILRKNLRKASKLYSYWSYDGYKGSEFPLLDNILPDGGASKALVKLLGLRAGGSHWEGCAAELETNIVGNDPNSFVC